jgi:hypothetical protein
VIAAVVVLALMVLCAGLALLVRSTFLAVLLAVACAVWPPFDNGRWEGEVLWTLSPGHGLTSMDLVTIPGVFLVVLACLLGRSRWKVLIAAACCLALPVGFASAYYVWSGPEVHSQYRGTPARVGHER